MYYLPKQISMKIVSLLKLLLTFLILFVAMINESALNMSHACSKWRFLTHFLIVIGSEKSSYTSYRWRMSLQQQSAVHSLPTKTLVKKIRENRNRLRELLFKNTEYLPNFGLRWIGPELVPDPAAPWTRPSLTLYQTLPHIVPDSAAPCFRPSRTFY